MPHKDNSRMLRAGVLVGGKFILDRLQPRGGARFTWGYPAETGPTIHRFSLFAFFWISTSILPDPWPLFLDIYSPTRTQS
jgi:hypothetical protein